MRLAYATAAGAALWVQPVQAATVVQSSSNQVPISDPGTFEGFDTSLGRLDAVSLAISGTEARLFGASYPEGATDPITIDWTVDGFANFELRSRVTGDFEQFAVPISGTGQVIVTEGWSWEMHPTGSGVFSIDPAFIPNDGDAVGPEMRVGFLGPGFYDWSDTDFVTSAPIQINLGTGGNCSSGFGQERCNLFSFSLTYTYTPTAELNAVPEPSTWAMMLLGFGAIGGAMRRRKVRPCYVRPSTIGACPEPILPDV